MIDPKWRKSRKNCHALRKHHRSRFHERQLAAGSRRPTTQASSGLTLALFSFGRVIILPMFWPEQDFG
jgi:hypothetical protein